MARQAVLLSVLLFLTGCGQESPSFRDAGQRVGESLTDFAKGVGSGVDNRLEVPVELTEQVSKLGLKTTVAKSSGFNEDGQKTVTVYFIAGQPVKAWLLAKALNAENQEVGRSAVEVELSTDDAKYVIFGFDREMDVQRVVKYVVEIGKAVPKDTKKPAKKTPADESQREV